MEKVVQWWTHTNGRTRLWHLWLVLGLAAICAATFAMGVPPLRIYGHDVFICLDGAWRVMNGQKPILDFYAAKGPLWFLFYGAFLKLAGGNAQALCYGASSLAIVMSLWSYFLLRRRMQPVPCALACVSLVLLAVSPFPLGESPRLTSFAMTFNRYGFALVSLVFLECFLHSASGDRKSWQFASGVSSGVASAIAIFVKISYGFVGLFLIAISLLFRFRERLRAVGILAGFAAVALPVLAYLGFDIRAIVSEYQYLASARMASAPLAADLFARAFNERWQYLLVVLLALVVAFQFAASRRRAILISAALLAVFCGFFLLVTNAQYSGTPLVAFAALLLLNEVTQSASFKISHPSTGVKWACLLCLCVGLLLSGSAALKDGEGMAYAMTYKFRLPQPFDRLRSAGMNSLRFLGNSRNDYSDGSDFVEVTDEGMELVRENSSASETVRALTNTNAFSIALARKPPRGGAIDINLGDVSETKYVPLDYLLGDVDLILIPKFPGAFVDREAEKYILSEYRDVLDREYVFVAESQHWRLLRKRSLEPVR